MLLDTVESTFEAIPELVWEFAVTQTELGCRPFGLTVVASSTSAT